MTSKKLSITLNVNVNNENAPLVSFKCTFNLSVNECLMGISVCVVMETSSLTTSIFIYCDECLTLL